MASVAAMSAAAAPVNAAPSHSKATASAKAVKPSSAERAGACSNSWKSAVGVPGRWTKIEDHTCSLWGAPGFKTGYQWASQRGRVCVKVKGYKNGREKWYDAGCGANGRKKNVPWGNVAANKAIKVKGFALFKWR